MKFQTPPREIVPFGLRALKMIAVANGPISDASLNILNAAQHALLGTQINILQLLPIEPMELAEKIVNSELRLQFVQAMLILSLADGPPTEEKMSLVDSFSKSLGVDVPELRSLRMLAEKHMLLFKLDYFRHTHIARVMKRSLQEDGLIQTAKRILGMRGLIQDDPLAERYRALKNLPQGTLGKEFANYIESNKFSFPGEKGGFPEGGIYHDFGHVLTGYGTDQQGEILMAAFQAGYMKEKPIFMLLFGIITFSAGVNVTPLPLVDIGGVFKQKGVSDRVFRALERGSQLKVDLSDHWDHWAFVNRSIDEVRAELNLLPE